MSDTFREICRDILSSENFRRMKKYIHHGNVSCYDHSIMVAALCYMYHRKKNPDYDISEFVRGALLHDYYLYDWHHKGEGHRLHGFRHPTFAYINARKEFEVTPLMRDMILHHMFPLIILPPHTKAGWALTWFDKVAAHHDYKRARHNRRKK